jgi:hypothetical protein
LKAPNEVGGSVFEKVRLIDRLPQRLPARKRSPRIVRARRPAGCRPTADRLSAGADGDIPVPPLASSAARRTAAEVLHDERGAAGRKAREPVDRGERRSGHHEREDEAGKVAHRGMGRVHRSGSIGSVGDSTTAR